jgi:predicted amidohydrolase YtcJ
MSPRATLLHGGRVHVGDGTSGEALLIRDGRIAAVGAARELRRDASDAELVDLRGGLAVPGWCDAHVHFMWWSFQMTQLDLREVRAIDEAFAQIGRHVAGLRAEAWLVGGRFDKNLWGRWPNASELDRVTGAHPAVLRSRDGHSRWLNTRALELAGIDATTMDPAGGRIGRDREGRPDGILFENATRIADAVIPLPTPDDCLEALRRGQQEAWRRGVVAVEDFEDAFAYQAWQRLHAAGELGLRVSMGIPYHTPQAAVRAAARAADKQMFASMSRNPVIEQLDRANLSAPPHDFPTALATGMRSGDGDEWLRIGHLKIFTDGALGSQTAALEEPYAGSDDRGILTIDRDEIIDSVSRAAAAGIAVAIHAIGDRAVHLALDAIEPTRRTAPALRQKVEHVQLVRTDDLGRFAKLGIVASMQPIHATSDRDLADQYWGPGRVKRSYPWRTFLASGAVLAFGSDAPVEPIDPLLGIHAAVARRRPGDKDAWTPDQRLTLDEALAGYASGAAYALGREREAGTLARGMVADITVLDRDLAAVGEDEIPRTRVRATIAGGVVRFADGLG